jgi:DNA polymerase I-like protein with 3'-5' exonuclease and polymerase domains
MKLALIGDGIHSEQSLRESRWGMWLIRNVLEPAGVQIKECQYQETPGVPAVYFCEDQQRDTLLLKLGIRGIADYRGHIQEYNGSIVGVTYHPRSVRKNPNLLPVIVRDICNVQEAARKPKHLYRPVVNHSYEIPYQIAEEILVDLEWNVATNETTVVGVAYSVNEAHSTYDVTQGIETVRKHLSVGTRVMGHNIVEADLPRIGEPRSYAPQYVFDTKIVAHLVHPHLASTGLLDLGSLTRLYFPTREWKQDKGDMLDYNGYDCVYNFRLAKALQADLTITEQWHLVERQQRLAKMAHEMAAIGIRLDKDGLWNYVKTRDDAKQKEKISIPGLANANSTDQIILWLSNEHNVSVRDTTFQSLSKLKNRHPDIDRLIAYREDFKGLSTWFPLQFEGKGKKRKLTGVAERQYFHHNVTGTMVDRFSSDAAQNIPPHLKRFFIPPDDYIFVNIDAKQLENRTVAWLAGDYEALEAWKTIDPYTMTACVMFGKTEAEIKTDKKYWSARNEDKQSMRFKAKTTELASIYGETYFNLSNRLFGNQKKESLAEAQRLQGLYFTRRPKIKQWQDEIAARYHTGEWTFQNPYGRQRTVYAGDEHEFKKKACHFLGCSTGANHINSRTLRIWDELRIIPALLVHDAWAGWVPKGDEGMRLIRGMVDIFQQPIPELNGLSVPVDVKIGPNYGEMQEISVSA